jgi:hypothetical protein
MPLTEPSCAALEWTLMTPYKLKMALETPSPVNQSLRREEDDDNDFQGCHTPFREIGNEASIRVPRMFKSHTWQQYDKQMQCY